MNSSGEKRQDHEGYVRTKIGGYVGFGPIVRVSFSFRLVLGIGFWVYL